MSALASVGRLAIYLRCFVHRTIPTMILTVMYTNSVRPHARGKMKLIRFGSSSYDPSSLSSPSTPRLVEVTVFSHGWPSLWNHESF